MDKTKKLTTKKLVFILLTVFLACGCVLGGIVWAQNHVKKVTTDEEFTYVNPDETKAETDEGFKIDGVLDEAQYKNNNWLYLHNKDKSSDVDVAMTSYFGEKGMYFVYDVTDRNPIYVNLERGPFMNSCIEMYLAPNNVTSNKTSHLFEIDLLPTGDMLFKKTNGKGGFTYVTTTNDIMAYLGATTKGGEVNTKECTGYCLELFIPWEYMEWFDIDSVAMKNSYIYVNPAHITSLNYDGTSIQEDRYWYSFAQQQQGASMDAVYQFYRFDGTGVIGTIPTKVDEGVHCSVVGDPALIPGMKTTYTITPENGYAVHSVLVNGKEQIQNVSYNEEGAALLTVFGKTEGLNIKASAEPITEGNKTLSGTVKIDGDSLKDVSISYLGINGKKTISLDKHGKFTVSNLRQGFYTITVEKEGYAKIERGIYLNRNITTELEFVAFTTTTGTSWIKGEKEDGVLRKFGGKGIVMSNASYNKFTVEVNLQHDKELEKEYEHTYFTQQRQGIRIKFSNDKYWDVNIYYADGVYKVQYPMFMGDNSVFAKYINVYQLSEKEIEKYTSKNGIQLKVVRDGKYANVYIDDRLISIEVLDDAYEKCSAQVGFSAWTANRVAKEYKYQITSDAKSLKKYAFYDSASEQYVQAEKVTGKLQVSHKSGDKSNTLLAYAASDFDVTVKTKRHTDLKNITEKYDVMLDFANGKNVSFYLGMCKGKWSVTNLNITGDNQDERIIYKRDDVIWGTMNDAELKQFVDGDGLDFRIVRDGTNIMLYLGNRYLGTADLAKDYNGKTTGIDANTTASVTIRHYGNWDATKQTDATKTVEVTVPYKMDTTFKASTITTTATPNGTITASRTTCVVGDTIVITGTGKAGYRFVGVTVNGKQYPLDASDDKYAIDANGTYTFTTTENKYEIKGIFEKIAAQTEGVMQISHKSGSKSNTLLVYAVRDFDLTVKTKRHTDLKNTTEKYDVMLDFANGKNVSFYLGMCKGKWSVTNLNITGDNQDERIIYQREDVIWGTVTDAELKQFIDGEGLDFRIVRDGTNIMLYLGSRYLGTADLAKDYNGKATGIDANTTASVTIRHYGNWDEKKQTDTAKTVEVTVPYKVDTSYKTSTITTTATPNGTITASRTTCVVGDTIVITGTGKAGYRFVGVTVNGKQYPLDASDDKYAIDANGTYTFTTTENKYEIKGIFEKIATQTEGVMQISHKSGVSSSTVLAYAATDIDVTVKAKRHTDLTKETEKYDVMLDFANGKNISFYLGLEKGTWGIRNLNITGTDTDSRIICKRGTLYGTLTDAERTTQFTDGDGIALRIVRTGTDMMVYIGDRYLGTVDLSKDYNGEPTDIKGDTAVKVTVRHYGTWSATNTANVQVDIPFTVKRTVDEVDGTLTATHASGATSSNTLMYGVKDVDVTVKAKRHTALRNTTEKYDIMFDFANGKNISFYLGLENDTWGIRNLNITGTDTDSRIICKRGTQWGTLSDAEFTQFTGADGVDFRIVRTGTSMQVYVGDRQLGTVDLLKDYNGNDTGIKADTTVKVTVRHYGNWSATNTANVQVDIPFKMTIAPQTAVVANLANAPLKLAHANTLGSVLQKLLLRNECN